MKGLLFLLLKNFFDINRMQIDRVDFVMMGINWWIWSARRTIPMVVGGVLEIDLLLFRNKRIENIELFMF